VKKKGVSPVIATVLLLVLTIVAISILAVFIIPFVKNSLGSSKGCFDVLGDIKFDAEGRYNCHAQSTSPLGTLRTGFSVRIDSDEIVGFSLTLFQQGSANSFRIENGTTDPDVVSVLRMLTADFNKPLIVPIKGGVRTYVAKGAFERAEVNPILSNGKTCDAQETIVLNPCTDSEAISALLAY